MKKLNVLFLLLTVFAFSALAQNGLDEKGVDNSDYFVNAKADAITVVLDASSPTFGRRYHDGYTATCDHLSYASSQDNVFYDVIPFYTTSDEALDISCAMVSGTDDYIFFVYCNPFDAANPDLNILAIDDDGGEDWLPAFDPANGFDVAANTQYYLVVSPWYNNHIGTVDITFGGDFVVGTVPPPPPPPPTVPLSNWAFGLIALLSLGFVFVRFRR